MGHSHGQKHTAYIAAMSTKLKLLNQKVSLQFI